MRLEINTMTVSMPFLQILSSSCWEIANGAQDRKGDVLLKYKRDSLLWELVVAEVGNIIKRGERTLPRLFRRHL